jgi:hypothetical protein
MLLEKPIETSTPKSTKELINYNNFNINQTTDGAKKRGFGATSFRTEAMTQITTITKKASVGRLVFR